MSEEIKENEDWKIVDTGEDDVLSYIKNAEEGMINAETYVPDTEIGPVGTIIVADLNKLHDNQLNQNVSLEMIEAKSGNEPSLIQLGNSKEVKEVELKLDRLRREESERANPGFFYKSKCKICNLALNDPDLHRYVISTNFVPQKLANYCVEIHGDPVKWDQASNHINKHFIPKYRELEFKRKEFQLMCKRMMRQKEKTSLPMRMAEAEEQLNMIGENLLVTADPNDRKDYRESVRAWASVMAVRKQVWEVMLKVMGMEQNPEEMQRIMHNAMQEKLRQALDLLPEEDRKRMIGLLQTTTKST
jgi:hypothetical protein